MEEKDNKALGDEDAEERKWTDWLKKGGSVSFIDLSKSGTGWSTPPGNFFVVRGPQYLTDKVKISGGDPLLTPLAFDWLKSGSRIDNVMGHPSSRVMKALDQASKRGKGKPFVWAFNLQVPSKEHFSAVSYFVSYNDFPEGSLWDQILKGDDAHRNTHLKLIANIVEGPWIVKTAVGAHAICILGKTLTCRYLQGENFLEVDVDIGSSMVANAIVHLAIGYINSLTVDMAFLIEGQAEEELPEKLLGTIRLKQLDLSAAIPLELLSKEEGTNFGDSFPSRLWRSLGLSTFLQPEAPTQHHSDDEGS